ncbi:DUF445 family protein [Paenibacillus sp. 481]|uniref:DUF445 family protein n=1 Tax=Paenibacillus sp. 481 TaxID=2835869 RepID=UPI001E4E2C20|nr:DUF445 family protein [Paenibacillus sp. 481]UHA72422.1 DUF445 family protein [Paenibacillus sp. 481]
MPTWLFILFSVSVAAVVGGITNHFAIKMLFHPRIPIKIGRWRVPFTPGLIPKRKEDIAASLGDVVAEYLVTSDGLRAMLNKPNVQEKATSSLLNGLERWLQDERTVREWSSTLFPDREWEDVRDQLAERLQAWTDAGFRKWWTSNQLDVRPLSELLPMYSDETRERIAARTATLLLSAVREEILSPNGQHMLRKMASGVLERTQGFFGTMAAMFVDEDKLVSKMTPIIAEQLHSISVHTAVAQFIANKLQEWGNQSPAELIRAFTDQEHTEQEPVDWLLEHLPALTRWTERVERLGDVRPTVWLGQVRHTWEPYVPRVVEVGLRLLDNNLERLVAVVNLQEMVRMQVERFPVERLETIILSVSGKEFRAITWLGAVLGGLIGLLQGVVMLALK